MTSCTVARNHALADKTLVFVCTRADGARMRVRVHQLHHQRVSGARGIELRCACSASSASQSNVCLQSERQVPEGETQDHQRR